MKFVVWKRRNIFKVLLAVLVAVLVVVSVSATNSASVYLGKTSRQLPIYSVDTSSYAAEDSQQNAAASSVALTFDAAWGADNTLKILDILEQAKVPATFFLVGFWAEKYPEVLKKLASSPLIEIGTHSNTHPNMPKLSATQMELELTSSINTIKGITGKEIDLFRAPFGDYSDTMLNVTKIKGLHTIQWDVDSLDWKDVGATEMAASVINKCKKGSIVLMHNDGKFTPNALPLMIAGLKNKGLTFSTVGNLIMRDNYTINHEGKQIRSK